MSKITCRDLIVYILKNGLEDEPLISENGNIIGFMNENEAAAKFGVGTSSIRTWINQDLLQGILVNDTILIPIEAKNPIDILKGAKNGFDVDVPNKWKSKGIR